MAKKNDRYFEIIFEDDEMLVINKASGVYSINPRHHTRLPVLADILQKKYGEIFIVHRIDRDTSGLIIFAKNENSHRMLSEQFTEGSIQKSYFVFVDGHMDFEGAYMIDAPVFVDPGKFRVRIDPAGKIAQTKIRIVQSYPNFTMLEAKLITGRTHQIRVHMQYIGNPLIVDKLYGARQEFFLSEIKHKYKIGTFEEERPLIARQTLHSHEVSLWHKPSSQQLVFNAPLPKDLRALKSQLDKTIR
jgi:RluA family pseudouridine synthase